MSHAKQIQKEALALVARASEMPLGAYLEEREYLEGMGAFSGGSLEWWAEAEAIHQK